MTRYLTLLTIGIGLLAGCVKEPPPRSTNEFFENPILLEAAMVRCSENRDRTRYDAECVNAREAVKRIAAQEDLARKAELEARSESMRRARRRAQEAAAAVRRRAQDAARRREEAEYLAQFGVLPNAEGSTDDDNTTGNAPLVDIPQDQSPVEPQAPLRSGSGATTQASDGSNAPSAPPPTENGESTSLDAIREELRQRNEDSVD